MNLRAQLHPVAEFVKKKRKKQIYQTKKKKCKQLEEGQKMFQFLFFFMEGKIRKLEKKKTKKKRKKNSIEGIKLGCILIFFWVYSLVQRSILPQLSVIRFLLFFLFFPPLFFSFSLFLPGSFPLPLLFFLFRPSSPPPKK